MEGGGGGGGLAASGRGPDLEVLGLIPTGVIINIYGIKIHTRHLAMSIMFIITAFHDS